MVLKRGTPEGLSLWEQKLFYIRDVKQVYFDKMPTSLQEGQKAPAFSGKSIEGETVRLSSFKGKKVILYFYPQDDTPGCTAQACNLRDNHSKLLKAGFEVIGVSPDDVASHQKFTSKYKLPFTLIADPGHSILEKYGVWGEKKLYGRTYMGVQRTTFLIDEKGIIRKIFLRPDTKNHAEEVLKAAKEIGLTA